MARRLRRAVCSPDSRASGASYTSLVTDWWRRVATSDMVREPPAVEPTGDVSDAARPWHAMRQGEVLAVVESNRAGLTSAEAARRLARDGPNVLGEPERASVLSLVGAQFRSPVVGLLVVAAIVTAATRQW
ncbi:MAG TPA: cation-transporting P-type ATPase, partial [Gemmatimonadaceae bacterium]|nr:cation-transporting P-type ATPase [Gemmatimonadaceae bacterium]